MTLTNLKLVSACLAGKNCRFDGENEARADILDMVARGEVVAVCPEEAGGLPTPRIPSEIVGGTGEDVLEGRARVVNAAGEDVTVAFLKGARQALEAAVAAGVTEAILKEGSPSCGVCRIRDGSFTGGKRPGNGVTTALLMSHGIRVRGV